MVKEELIKRSPLRVFEQSIHGGLGKGELGVLTSRKGVGKTACLVHIATDKLFQGQQVIHVSFSQNVAHVISWYEDIFDELTEKEGLDNPRDLHDEIVKHRVIMNFNQEQISIDQILSSLRAMIEQGGFKADAVMFDGYRLTNAEPADIEQIRSFAQEMGIVVWFSVSAVDDSVPYDQYGVSEPVKSLAPYIDVLIGLAFEKDHVSLTLVKERTEQRAKKLSLKLDPKSLLILKQDEQID